MTMINQTLCQTPQSPTAWSFYHSRNSGLLTTCILFFTMIFGKIMLTRVCRVYQRFFYGRSFMQRGPEFQVANSSNDLKRSLNPNCTGLFRSMRIQGGGGGASVTGGPIFANLVSKYPQDFKEKCHEAARRFCVRGKICLGEPPSPPPTPPPVQLGLNLEKM